MDLYRLTERPNLSTQHMLRIWKEKKTVFCFVVFVLLPVSWGDRLRCLLHLWRQCPCCSLARVAGIGDRRARSYPRSIRWRPACSPTRSARAVWRRAASICEETGVDWRPGRDRRPRSAPAPKRSTPPTRPANSRPISIGDYQQLLSGCCCCCWRFGWSVCSGNNVCNTLLSGDPPFRQNLLFFLLFFFRFRSCF